MTFVKKNDTGLLFKHEAKKIKSPKRLQITVHVSKRIEMITYFLCITGNCPVRGRLGPQYSNNWFIHLDSETQSHGIKDMREQHNPNETFTKVSPNTGLLCACWKSQLLSCVCRRRKMRKPTGGGRWGGGGGEGNEPRRKWHWLN